jgi:hypothetical protein
LPGSVQILAELIQGGGETLQSEIRKLINSTWSKEELPISGRRMMKLNVVIIKEYYCYQLHTKCYPMSFSHG